MNEYVAQAVAQLEGNAEGSSAAEPEAPAGQVAEAGAAEGSAESASETPDSGASPAEEPKADAKSKSLLAIAAEKAALRKQKEEIAQRQKDFAKLDTAIQAKDPLALLAAAGFSYQQLVEQVINGKVTSEAPKEGAPAEWQTRVQALEQELAKERATRARLDALGRVKDLAAKGGDKFALTRERNMEDRALAFLEDHYQKTGEMPGESFEESLEIALEAVEEHLNSELEQWLTTSKARAKLGSAGVNTSPPQGTGGADGSAAKVVKTLTNAGTTAPAKRVAPPEPKTAEDYRRLALQLLEKD